MAGQHNININLQLIYLIPLNEFTSVYRLV